MRERRARARERGGREVREIERVEGRRYIVRERQKGRKRERKRASGREKRERGRGRRERESERKKKERDRGGELAREIQREGERGRRET